MNYPVLNFFRALSVCHTVVCDVSKQSKTLIPLYQASSPDELALVQGSSEVGIIFKQRSHSKIDIINTNASSKIVETYKILAEFPFDSTRKCMSVIVMDEKSRIIYLYCKGADNVMLDKIMFRKESRSSNKQNIIEDLHRYSCEGFRTLVIAMKQITDEEYLKFD
jgi:magnesium-transporting ATPase (P-type)